MDKSEECTFERLCGKSQEAFLLAIELYNRPTIKYRVEGCAFSFAMHGSFSSRHI